MTRIDAASALNALLRSQPELLNRVQSAPGIAVQGAKRGEESKGQTKATQSGGSTFHLESQLLRRIRSIAENDPERRRKVFRVFLESVLMKELGFLVETDPELSRIVDRVLQQFNEDAGLRESSLLAADVLIEQSKAG